MLEASPQAAPPPPPAPTAAPAPPPVSLPSGVYLISSDGSSVDGGFGFYNQTPLYPTNSGSGQQWRWNASTFSNVPVAAGGSGAAGPLACRSRRRTAENASGDAWTKSPSGNGYTIRDSPTGNYRSVVSNALAMSATRTGGASERPSLELFGQRSVRLIDARVLRRDRGPH